MVFNLLHILCVKIRLKWLCKELMNPHSFYPVMHKQSLYDLLEILYAQKYDTCKSLATRLLLTNNVLSQTEIILYNLLRYDYFCDQAIKEL